MGGSRIEQWWADNVRGRGRSNNADPGYFVEDAEKLTGITQQQVSKWAKRLRDWPLLETAIDAKLDQQDDFVNWWRENVRRAGKPKANSSGSARIASEDAQELTGITEPQVSKWAKRLDVGGSKPLVYFRERVQGTKRRF